MRHIKVLSKGVTKEGPASASTKDVLGGKIVDQLGKGAGKIEGKQS